MSSLHVRIIEAALVVLLAAAPLYVNPFSITLLNPQAMKLVDFTQDGNALKGALDRLAPRVH